MDKVSILIPVYNQERYIKECIESALAQTYPNCEIVVVDDGSTDRTSSIIRSFGKKIRYIRQSNKGAAAALNRGLRVSTGKYIGWLSSDDIYLPTKIKEQMKFFQAHPEVAATYTDFQIIDGHGKITQTVRSPYFKDKKEFIFNLIRGNFINGSSVVFKKSCIDRSGYFDEKMKYHADGDMWFKMLKHFRFGHVPKVLLKYRWHEKNASHDTRGMKRFLYPYYSKILNLYSREEIFDGPESQFRRELVAVFASQSLYLLAAKSFWLSITANPFDLTSYRNLSSFIWHSIYRR